VIALNRSHSHIFPGGLKCNILKGVDKMYSVNSDQMYLSTVGINFFTREELAQRKVNCDTVLKSVKLKLQSKSCEI